MEPGFFPCPACSQGYRFQPFRVCEVCGGESILMALTDEKAEALVKTIQEAEEEL